MGADDLSSDLLKLASSCLSEGGAAGTRALKKLGFKDARRAGQALDRLVVQGTPLSPMPPEVIAQLAAAGHPDRGLAHLERLVEVSGGGLLFGRLAASPRLREYFIRLLSHSRFLTDILVRNPEHTYWLLEGGTPFLELPMAKRQMRDDVSREVRRFERSADRFQSLRRWQRRELLRLGAGEVLGLKDVAASGQELADLADIVVEQVLADCHRELSRRFGKPFDTRGRPAHFCVVCLGKHGGRELNFSSDIDLLFVYSSEGHTKHGVDNDFFFNRLSEHIVKALTEVTGEGFLYRVDMRLRPDGETGALARSVRGYWAHYELRGALWERQMLIKARRAAGSPRLWQQFRLMLMPFVFPPHFEVGPHQEIRRIKERIEAEIGARPNRENNIKLRAGGIRDIEFTVQCLQLLAGRRNERLRAHNTLVAIDRLLRSGDLSADEGRTLAAAYRLFRRVESMLQIHEGRAVYAIPESKQDRKALALVCGFTGVSAFDRALEKSLRSVRSIFDAVFEGPDRAAGEMAGNRLLDLPAGADAAAAELEAAGFDDGARAHRTLVAMADNEMMTSVARQHLRQMLPELLVSLGATPDPDRGLVQLTRIMAAYGAPGVFLELLQARPGFRSMMVRICGSSRLLAELMRRDPSLLDALVTRPEQQATEEEDGERLPPALWSHRRDEQLLRIGTDDLLGLATAEETFWRLSALADRVLRWAHDEARRNLARRYGKPRTNRGNPARFVCVAGGKLGGMELNFGSDLDLFFLYEGEGRTGRGMENRDFYTRLTQEVMHLLNANNLYEVDARLRPEGRRAPVVMSLTSYRRYLQRRAAVWERLALTRARVVSGDPLTARRVERAIERFVFRPVDEQMVDAVVAMRRRMEPRGDRGRPVGVDIKRGPGGIVDIEFITQIVMIHFARKDLRPLHTRTALEAMAAEQMFLSAPEGSLLLSAYDRLRDIEKTIRVTTDRATTALPGGAGLRSLAAQVGSTADAAGGGTSIQAEVTELMGRTRETFLRVMDRLKSNLQ